MLPPDLRGFGDTDEPSASEGATRERVLTLCFAETLLSGMGLEEWSHFTPENVSAQFDLRGVWVWHIPFFWIPDLPEMLITGREREFWEHWIKAETYNPMAIAEEAIDEWISKLKASGGLRGCLETYRAGLAGSDGAGRAGRAGRVFDECGHSFALEADERLASFLGGFMLDR